MRHFVIDLSVDKTWYGSYLVSYHSGYLGMIMFDSKIKFLI